VETLRATMASTKAAIKAVLTQNEGAEGLANDYVHISAWGGQGNHVQVDPITKEVSFPDPKACTVRR